MVEEIVGEQVRNLVQKHPTVSSVEECADAVIELVMMDAG